MEAKWTDVLWDLFIIVIALVAGVAIIGSIFVARDGFVLAFALPIGTFFIGLGVWGLWQYVKEVD